MSISTISLSGNDYVSYASVVEANARLFVDPTRGATWATLTDEQKGVNLVAATNRLDLLRWRGAKAGGAAQANQWPRNGMQYCDGTTVATDALPLDVESATIILAGSIALDSATADAGTSGTNIKSVKAGSTGVNFFQPKDGVPLQDETAYKLILCYLESTDAQTASTGAYAPGSGADAGSTCFGSSSAFDLNKGYY